MIIGTMYGHSIVYNREEKSAWAGALRLISDASTKAEAIQRLRKSYPDFRPLEPRKKTPVIGSVGKHQVIYSFSGHYARVLGTDIILQGLPDYEKALRACRTHLRNFTPC